MSRARKLFPARIAARSLVGRVAAGACTAALLVGLPAGASAQAVVSGVVYDSTTASPLADARVVLWQTSHQAETDASGRFEIPDVPAGEYSLVFFHERLAHLGVSSGSRRIVVEGTRDLHDLLLATPSLLTIMAAQCAMDDPGSVGSLVAGRVGDAETGIAMPMARVVFRWATSDGELRSRSAVADGEGWYRVCDLPDGVVVAAEARFLDRATPTRHIEAADGSPRRLDFLLGSLAPVDISGVVEDADSGQPIPGVEVRLVDAGETVISDVDGRFRFRTVNPGIQELSLRHIAYGDQKYELSVAGGIDLSVDVKLSSRPIEMEPITVSVRSQFEASAIAMGGRLIGPAEIEKVRYRSRDLGDLLRAQHVPGLMMERDRGQGVCVGFTTGQVKMFRRGGCESAEVYIDGVRATEPYIAMSMPAEAVDRVVLFKPVEAGNLFRIGSANGVILVFTRQGQRRR